MRVVSEYNADDIFRFEMNRLSMCPELLRAKYRESDGGVIPRVHKRSSFRQKLILTGFSPGLSIGGGM